MGEIARMHQGQRLQQALSKPFMKKHALPAGDYELVGQELAGHQGELAHMATLQHAVTGQEFEVVIETLFDLDSDGFALISEVAWILGFSLRQAERMLVKAGAIDDGLRNESFWQSKSRPSKTKHK